MQTYKNQVEISQTFINSMFQHSLFKTKFYDLMGSAKSLTIDSFVFSKNGQASQIVEEISETIFQNLIETQEQIRDHFQRQLITLYQQIQKLKDLSYQNIGRIDDLPKEQEQEPILQDDQMFDLPSCKRTMSFLKEKAKEISQHSTVILESSQISKQYKENNQVFSDKITVQITKIEKKLACQHEALQDTVNQKIDKQQKTINNILQTLNDLSGPDKKDKNSPTLTNCKSATKLKSFFGFA